MAVLAHVGRTEVAAYFKREMLACIDYGSNTFPLPFAYPDARMPSEVSGERSLPIFWAGHRKASRTAGDRAVLR